MRNYFTHPGWLQRGLCVALLLAAGLWQPVMAQDTETPTPTADSKPTRTPEERAQARAEREARGLKPKNAAKKEESKEDKEPAQPDPAEADTSSFELPIPLGQTSTGVVVQDLGPDGRDQGVMSAREATRVSDDDVELGDLNIRLLPTPKQPRETTISMQKGVYNVKTCVLRSRSKVHISREDFDIYGDAMEYNTLTGYGQLFGEVRMTIHDANKFTKPAAAATPEAGAQPQPAPGAGASAAGATPASATAAATP